jgi:hypothetical protein
VIQRNADSAFVYLIKPDKTGTNQTVAMQTITLTPPMAMFRRWRELIRHGGGRR